MFVLMRKKCPQNTGWVHIDWEKLLSFPPNHLHLPLSPVFVSNWRLECHRRVKSRNVLLEVMAETWMSSLIASLMSRLICISPPTCKTGCNIFLLPDVLYLDTVGVCVDVALASWAPLVDMVHCIRLRLKNWVVVTNHLIILADTPVSPRPPSSCQPWQTCRTCWQKSSSLSPEYECCWEIFDIDHHGTPSVLWFFAGNGWSCSWQPG